MRVVRRILALALTCTACNLNPQPLPPDQPVVEAGPSSVASPDAGTGGLNTGGGTSDAGDATVFPPPQAEGGVPIPSEAGDSGTSDGSVEGGTEDASDATLGGGD